MQSIIQKVVGGMQRRDSAVAVVIGTILLIAISISLLTSYLFWFLPYQGTLNEQNYYLATESAFNSLDSKMINTQLVPGAFATQPINMGVPGEPPFTSATDTTVLFSNQSSTNSFSLHLVFNLTFSTAQGHQNASASEYFNSSGLLYTAAQMQYVISYGFAITNGLVIRDQGTQSNLISNTHFLFSNNSDNFSLYTSMLDLAGKSSSVGGYGSTVFQAEYLSVKNQTLSVGANSTSFNSSIIGTISSINVLGLSLNITSPFANAYDRALIIQYNGSALSSSSHWFISHALVVNLTGNNLLVKNIKILNVEALSVEFLQAEILAV